MQTFEINARPDLPTLLQPTVHHQSPIEVLNDPDLEPFEKRAILSSWASDLNAVETLPWLREVPGVRSRLYLRDILAALRALDDNDDPPSPGGASMRIAGTRGERVSASW